MNIFLSSFSQSAVFFIKEKISFSLTDQQKKITAIASAVFGILTTCYLVNRFYFQHRKIAKRMDMQNKPFDKVQGSSTAQKGKKAVEEKLQSESKKVEKEEQSIPLNGEEKTLDDGTVLKGTFKDGKLNGRGEKHLKNGTVIKGEFKDGLLHGIGTVVSSKEGVVAEGSFYNDSLHGKAKITFIETDETWEGEFKHGEFVEGEQHLPNGDICKGTFNEDGELVSGEKKLRIGGNVLKGEFENGYLVKGTKTLPSGIVDEGEFTKNRLVKGKKTFVTRCIWKGTFNQAGSLEGQGTMYFPNGETRVGVFETGVFIKGTITKPDGTIATGEFTDYQLDGKGTLTFKNGERWEGEFKGGQLVKGQKKLADGTILDVDESLVKSKVAEKPDPSKRK